MSIKGEIKYLVHADDSQIEAELEQSNKKVEEAVKKSAEKTIKVEKEKTQDIKQEFNKVEDAAKNTSDKVEKSWKDAADDIGDSFKETNDQVEKDTKDVGNVFENVSGLIKDSFSDAATGAIPLLGQIEALTKGLSGVSGVAVGIGAAFIGVGAASVGVATDMDSAMNDFIASTGKTKEETERYQQVLENIYANNYGEDFQDISDSMEQVVKNLGDLDDSALQNVTESAYALRDTFEYEIAESTKAAKALMDNFGVSGEEAMSLIAAGAQNGLDYSGEFLDSISEYSVQFEKMGFSADDMFKIFEQGAESGAWSLDKIGDAVKEFSIRAIDGSDTTKEGFKTIGLNADEMASKFAAGGESAKEAFQQTVEALASIEDPLAQDATGVALFGTMWEDLGPEVVTALADIEDGAYDTADAMNQIKEVKYDDLGSMFEALKRNVELLVLPIGEALIPLFSILIEAVLPVLSGLLGPLIDLFAELLVPILSVITTAIQPLIDILNFLITNAIEPLIAIITAVLVPLFSGSLESMFNSASGMIGNIINIFKNLLQFILNVFTGNWEGAWNNIAEIFKSLLTPIQGVVESAIQIFANLIGFIINTFTGNWRGAWNNVKNIFSSAISGLAAIFKAPINAIVDGWNKLVSSLGSITIPEWVPEIGGGTFSLPKLPRLKVGMDYVPSDMFPAFLDKGEWVLTKDEAAILRSLGGVDGMLSLLDRGYSRSEIVVMDSGKEIDYDAIGDSVYSAFKRHGMSIVLDRKELGRVVEEVLRERGW